MKENWQKSLLKNYPFQLPQAMEWGDMDAFAHLNNVAYIRYFENLRTRLLEHIGLMTPAGVPPTIGPILAKIDCRFLAPVSYPDDLFLGGKIGEIRESDFFIESVLASKKHNKIAAIGTHRVVAFDYSTQQKALLSPEIKSALMLLTH
ncbi:acyl-CoA thioesterase [Chitinophagales bacterium]|nr:acyl-CoA thioesterase [Chitinophagales bacterium]